MIAWCIFFKVRRSCQVKVEVHEFESGLIHTSVNGMERNELQRMRSTEKAAQEVLNDRISVNKAVNKSKILIFQG